MKKIRKAFSLEVRATTFLVVTSMIISLTATAVTAAGYDIKFSDDASLQTSLLQFQGKSVEVRLKSGDQLSGRLSNVGSHVILLKELQGKEFYDALVRIDEIGAVVFRAK
ncbi:MAG: hypothetical protein ACW97P_06260 [Candidatus Hodarchaeales archaeon]